jgi:hypothetical protein
MTVLATVPRVPILRTGHYDLQSGPVDFSLEHLHAAVAAWQNDPAVLAPRIRAETPMQGHLDGDGIAVEAAGGLGGPALGYCENLTVEGNTLYADLRVPEELAANLEWAYPSRSIEGLFGYTTATGQTHDFLATGLLLLGTSWPGVTTLPDIHELEAEFAQAVAEDETLVAAAGFAAPQPIVNVPDKAMVLARVGATGAPPKPARDQLATAGLNVSDLRQRWYGAEAAGELDGLPESYDYFNWYVTEVRADDGGQLYVLVLDESDGTSWRFDVDSINATEVSFSAPVPGSLDWRPATAAASGPRVARPALARWTSRADSRVRTATAETPQQEDNPMDDAQRRALALSLGLSEDATEADIHAHAAERATATPEPTGVAETPEPEAEVAETPEAELAVASGRTTEVDAAALAQLREDAQMGVAARQAQIKAERDSLISAALSDGRNDPASADEWRADLDKHPEATASALARLPKGTYPGAQARAGVAPQAGDRPGSLQRVVASIRGNTRDKDKVA